MIVLEDLFIVLLLYKYFMEYLHHDDLCVNVRLTQNHLTHFVFCFKQHLSISSGVLLEKNKKTNPKKQQ